MCELDILHDSLYQFCPELHLKRLNSLTLACHALLDCKTLTLTELGRNLPTKARTKHNIKRIDRLLGNRHLHKERLAVYRWHASFIFLVALMLQLTCWLAGVHAQKQGWDKHFQANTVRNRNVLSTVRLGMEVLRHSGYTITREDLLVAATLLAQNLFTHGYALGKL
ncbi:hypothetical protein [Klebsiella pneumoniae]|uniref:hypothetical protein n=1 Tax=Klebsiella pneumoniae TaxID=573 RepID=UPI000B9C63AE|nr:hypothetical protein [Klebsiella pneumoniae]OXT19937.1 hypothetical protein B1727_29760 [Klebsiella pneumoniae]